MASSNVPAPKRTSASNVDDDASVPTPKKTCNNNDEKETMIQSLKENPASVLALSKVLSCDACKSFARAPIRYCGLHHTICSICYTDNESKECLAEGCTGKLKHKTFKKSELTEAVRAMKLPVQCKNRKNGCPEKGEEKEVEEHEIECEFRFVETNVVCSGIRMFKDVFRAVSAKVKEREGKWKLCVERDDGKGYKVAYRDYIDPDGHIFRIILDAGLATFIEAHATVIGGKRVANRYRVEMRLNSCEKEFTNTHHGPVFPVDVKNPCSREECYTIAKKKFELFSKGFDYFGNHNKDKNGDIIVPIMVKIIKKELDIPKEESGPPVDMDVKEK